MSALPKLILLPGMHGTDLLFGPFTSALPTDQPWRIVSFPPDRVMNYDELLRWIENEVRDESDMIVIGESYGGPLAIGLAAAHPARVRAVVVSGSYVLPPFPSWLRWLVHPFLFRLPLPLWAVRFVVAGWKVSTEFAKRVRDALHQPTPEVFAFRARDTLTTDTSDALRRCACPMLYLAPDQDHLVLPFNLKRMLAICPDIQVRSHPGPHLILQSEPEWAWKALESFARKAIEHPDLANVPTVAVQSL